MTDDVVTRKKNAPDIFEAAKEDNVSAFQSALRAGSRLTDVTSYRRTAIHVCAMHGSLGVLKVCMQHPDFDPWRRDAGGLLPIDHALAKDYMEIHQLLYNAMYPPGWFLQENKKF